MTTYVYKVVLLGNYEVGKTTLFRKLRGKVNNQEDSEVSDSLELGPIMLEFQFPDSLKVKLEVTDTGSIEKFRGSIPTNYFRNVQGVALMYDLTKPPSLDDLEDWTTDARNKTAGDPTITYALIGNKIDQVQDESCSRRANIFGLKHEIPESLQFKISAANDSLESVREIFMTFARHIYAAQTNRNPTDYYESGTSLILSEEHADSEKKGCSRC